jgi:hypothetical protein
MKELEILADGNQGGVEMLGKVADQNAAFILKELEDLAPAFFVQHK